MDEQDEQTALRERALDVLCSPELEPLVELVLSSPGPDVYEARAVDGAVRFRRSIDGPGGSDWRFEIVDVEGRDPLGDQDPERLSPLAAETSDLCPPRQRNSYPDAFERLAQVFDHPAAPDLCVLHTTAHRWDTNRGVHGSLDVVQSRAPFILSGAGARRGGLVDGHCAMVDIAPTLLTLLGVPPGAGIGPTGAATSGALLSRQDGRARSDLLDSDVRPEHVVVILLDGANANVVHAAAASGDTGDIPNIARLLDRGTGFAQGSLASFPTVTLPNHTTLLTGCHPGHHGVLHNEWYDRSLGREIVTESPATWQNAMQWLLPGVETIHEALHRAEPDALTVSVNEAADRGADWSTFDLFRAGEAGRLVGRLPKPLPYADQVYNESNAHYRWGSTVDASALEQFESIWHGELLGREFPLPRFTWVSFSLTDAAFHEGGPHSAIARAALRESDQRVGAVLAAIERRGVLDRTAVAVVADHGMEENTEHVTGDWGEVLRAAGVEHRDEASGFLYLGVPPDTVPDAPLDTPLDPPTGAPLDAS